MKLLVRQTCLTRLGMVPGDVILVSATATAMGARAKV